MTDRSFRFPHPRRLPGEDEGLWSYEPRGREPEFRPAAERLRVIREEAWVEPSSASELRTRLYHNIEIDHVMSRGRGGFVIGPAGAGTSTFLQEAERGYRQFSGKRIALAALPDRVGLRDLLVAFRTAIGHDTDGRERTDDLERRLYDELGWSNVAAIAMDGMEQLVHAPPRARELTLFWLRHVGARGRFHLILSTPPALLQEMDVTYNGEIPATGQPEFIRSARPFQEYHLAPFRIDPEYVAVLDRWELSLPLLHASHLAGRELALHLYALCDGRYGRLAQVLRRAAAEALTSGRERITVQLLDDMGLRPPLTFSGFRF